jgi:hypothetical protein
LLDHGRFPAFLEAELELAGGAEVARWYQLCRGEGPGEEVGRWDNVPAAQGGDFTGWESPEEAHFVVFKWNMVPPAGMTALN